jgi:D-alanyl-D-alanine carboxypeptidase
MKRWGGDEANMNRNFVHMRRSHVSRHWNFTRNIFLAILFSFWACGWSLAQTATRSAGGEKSRFGRDITAYREIAQQRLDDFVREHSLPGASLAFVLDDGRCAAVASGVAHKGSGRAMKPNDRMLAGSIGKTYVAAVLLQLYEEGKVKLDDKIATWFGKEDWFPRLPNAEQITLRMLMNHTSGIPEHVMMPEFLAAVRKDPEKVWRPEELVAYVLDQPGLFPAGGGWSYADTNYILVGMIIERVTGRKYYDVLTERILRPLALNDTIPSDQRVLPGLVSGYTGPGNPFPVSEEVSVDGRCGFHPQMEWTGGGLLSTSLDLARWAKQLYGGEVLKAPTKAEMLQGVDALERLGPGHKYGLGTIIRVSKLGPVYGHSGWFPGYLSVMFYYPDVRLAVAFQTNTDVMHGSSAMENLLDKMCDALAAP